MAGSNDLVRALGFGVVAWAGVACTGSPESGGSSKPSDSDTGFVDSPTDTQEDSPTDTDTGGDTESTPSWGDPIETTADAKLVGPVPYGGGYDRSLAVAGGGDVDGDGFSDLLVGLPGGWSSAPGATYVVRGPVTGTFDLGLADAILRGSGNEASGYAVAFAGDVNADGFDDVIVGGPLFDSDLADGCIEGRAYLQLGPITGELSLAVADATFAGEVYPTSYGPNEEMTGKSVAGAGDVDGDGFDDVLIVEQSTATFLVRGPISGVVDLGSQADVRIGEGGTGQFESAVAAGDTNGDGLADILIGQPLYDSSRVACMFEGPVVGTTVLDADATYANAGSAYAGYGLSSAGDVDGDGYDDVMIGATQDDSYAQYAGAAFIVRGPHEGDVDLSLADATVLGDEYYLDLGIRVAAAGDVNADGFGDILIGSAAIENPMVVPGASFLVLGPISGTIPASDANLRLNGEDDDAAGLYVSPAGDVDNDGLADILIGGPGDDDGGEDAGAAWLVLGASIP